MWIVLGLSFPMDYSPPAAVFGDKAGALPDASSYWGAPEELCLRVKRG